MTDRVAKIITSLNVVRLCNKYCLNAGFFLHLAKSYLVRALVDWIRKQGKTILIKTCYLSDTFQCQYWRHINFISISVEFKVIFQYRILNIFIGLVVSSFKKLKIHFRNGYVCFSYKIFPAFLNAHVIIVKLIEPDFIWTGGPDALSGGNLYGSCEFQKLLHT